VQLDAAAERLVAHVRAVNTMLAATDAQLAALQAAQLLLGVAHEVSAAARSSPLGLMGRTQSYEASRPVCACTAGRVHSRRFYGGACASVSDERCVVQAQFGLGSASCFRAAFSLSFLHTHSPPQHD
jgi:hypothetical protein